MTVEGESIQLDNVPQGACPTCGSRVYRAAVLKRIECALKQRPMVVGSAR
jgi:hypothetical protein